VIQRAGHRLLQRHTNNTSQHASDETSSVDDVHVNNSRASPPPLDNKSQEYYEDQQVDVPRVGMATEVRMLFMREFRNVQRNRHPLIARFGLATFLALLVGTIFFGVGARDDSVPKVIMTHEEANNNKCKWLPCHVISTYCAIVIL
jgi:hypothetical protein